jgi:hypothetical protein
MKATILRRSSLGEPDRPANSGVEGGVLGQRDSDAALPHLDLDQALGLLAGRNRAQRIADVEGGVGPG